MSIPEVVLLLVNGADKRRKNISELCRKPPTFPQYTAHFVPKVGVAREEDTLIGPW